MRVSASRFDPRSSCGSQASRVALAAAASAEGGGWLGGGGAASARAGCGWAATVDDVDGAGSAAGRGLLARTEGHCWISSLPTRIGSLRTKHMREPTPRGCGWSGWRRSFWRACRAGEPMCSRPACQPRAGEPECALGRATPAACWQCGLSPTSCSLDASGAAGSGCARASRAGRPSPAWARPVPGPEPARRLGFGCPPRAGLGGLHVDAHLAQPEPLWCLPVTTG